MTGWEPANDIERAMLLAALADERQGYFQLVAAADLYLPQATGDAPGEQRFLTVRALGTTLLPVFTSEQALAAGVGAMVDGYTVTTYSELRRKWPDPDWRLAVNPGTPIDAYVPVDAVADAAVGDVAVPTIAEVVVDAAADEEQEERLAARHAAGSYGDDPHAALQAAAAAGDVHGYVERLLDMIVLVPTVRPVEPEAIVEPDFPWRPAPAGDAIEVFTSPAAFARSYPDPVPAVAVALPFALACWPAQYGLRVDPGAPGAPGGIELGADEVPWLLGLPD